MSRGSTSRARPEISRTRLDGDAGLGDGLAGRPVVLGLHVDRGEDAVRAHPAEQPHRADAGAGADLDDRLGADGGGQDREGGPASLADRRAAQLGALAAGGGQDLVLRDELLGVGPAGLQDPGDGGLPAAGREWRRAVGPAPARGAPEPSGGNPAARGVVAGGHRVALDRVDWEHARHGRRLGRGRKRGTMGAVAVVGRPARPVRPASRPGRGKERGWPSRPAARHARRRPPGRGRLGHGLDAAQLGRGRPHPLRAGLPAGLPADRQPARRRGPDPGRLRPGLPVAVQLHARAPSRAGCTASPRTSSWTRSAASSGSASTRWPTTPASGCPAASPARPRSTTTTTSTTTSSAPWTPCRPTSAPPSCSATSRACPTRRSPPRWASSSAPSAAASTAAGPSCAPRWSTGRPGGAAAGSRRRPE